jgi:hypothetical protein
MATYELIPKWATDEALECIENAKTAISFAYANNPDLSLRATTELDNAINKLQFNRTECNVQPAGV